MRGRLATCVVGGCDEIDCTAPRHDEVEGQLRQGNCSVGRAAVEAVVHPGEVRTLRSGDSVDRRINATGANLVRGQSQYWTASAQRDLGRCYDGISVGVGTGQCDRMGAGIHVDGQGRAGAKRALNAVAPLESRSCEEAIVRIIDAAAQIDRIGSSLYIARCWCDDDDGRWQLLRHVERSRGRAARVHAVRDIHP